MFFVKKSVLTSFWVWAAPESWLKFTTYPFDAQSCDIMSETMTQVFTAVQLVDCIWAVTKDYVKIKVIPL